jgi:hypothetical protein
MFLRLIVGLFGALCLIAGIVALFQGFLYVAVICLVLTAVIVGQVVRP